MSADFFLATTVEILNLAERETDVISTDWSIISASSVVSFKRSMVLSFKEVLVGDCGTKDHTAPIGEAQLYLNNP